MPADPFFLYSPLTRTLLVLGTRALAPATLMWQFPTVLWWRTAYPGLSPATHSASVLSGVIPSFRDSTGRTRRRIMSLVISKRPSRRVTLKRETPLPVF